MMESVFNLLSQCSSLSNGQGLSSLEFNALNGLLDCSEPPVPDIGSTVIINEKNQLESICESPSKQLAGKRVLCSFSANGCDLDEYPFHAVTFGEPGELRGLSYNDHNYTKIGEGPKQCSESCENQLDLLAKLALAKHETTSGPENQECDSSNQFSTIVDEHPVGKTDDCGVSLSSRTSNVPHVTIIKHPFMNQHIGQSSNQLPQPLSGTTCKVASANGRTILLTPTRGNIGASVQIHRVGSVNSPQVLLRSDFPSVSLDGIPLTGLSGNIAAQIRCICGFSHDDGCLIQCNNCRLLQHAECMSPNSGVPLPKPYYCEVCQPRPVMLADAINLQRKKMAACANPAIAPAKTIRVANPAGFRFPTNATPTTTTLHHLPSSNRFILTTTATTPVRPIQVRLGEISASAVLGQSVGTAGTTTLYQVDSSAIGQHQFPPRIVINEPRSYVTCTQRSSKRKQDLFTLAGESSQAFENMSNNFQFDENIQNVDENEELPAPKFYRSSSGTTVSVTTTTQSSDSLLDGDVSKQQLPHQLQQQHYIKLPPTSSCGVNSAASLFPTGVPEPASEDVVIWSDSYEKASETRLSDALKQRVRNFILTSSSRDLDALQLSDATLSSFRGTQRCRVTTFEFNRKGLAATEHLYPRQPVIEYKGHAMLMDEYNKQHDFRRHYNPFVLFYKKLDKTVICLDASNYGNDARFIRRSCTPNCEISLIVPPTDSYSSVVNPQCIQFVVTSTRLITSGTELTIPFDFDYTTCSYPVKCACTRKGCSVARWYRCGYQSLMQGGRSPGLSDHKSLSGHEGYGDDLPPHRHDDFDDDEDEDEDEDYDNHDHPPSLIHRSKPSFSFSDRGRGRISLSRLLAPKRINSMRSVFSRLPYQPKQQQRHLSGLNSEPIKKRGRGRGRGRARGCLSTSRTPSTLHKNRIPVVRYQRGRPPSMASRQASGRGGSINRSTLPVRQRQLSSPTFAFRKPSLSPPLLPRTDVLNQGSDDFDSSSSVYSPADTDITEPTVVDLHKPKVTAPLPSYEDHKSTRHSSLSLDASPQRDADETKAKNMLKWEETRRRKRRSELSQSDIPSTNLSSVTSPTSHPQKRLKPFSPTFIPESDVGPSNEIHPKSPQQQIRSALKRKPSRKLSGRLTNETDSTSLKQSEGSKVTSNSKRARRQTDSEAPGEQGDVLSSPKDDEQVRVNSNNKSREESWLAEVLRRIERLEKKQKKHPSVSYSEKDYLSGVHSNYARSAANFDDTLGSPNTKISPNLPPNFSPLSNTDADQKKWSLPLSSADTKLPDDVAEEIKNEPETTNDEDMFLLSPKDENAEGKNRRRRSQVSFPVDSAQSRLSREDRWLNAQIRRIAEMEKLPKLKSSLSDEKYEKPEQSENHTEESSHNEELKSARRLPSGRGKCRKRNNSGRGRDLSPNRNGIDPSNESWRSPTNSPMKSESVDSPKDGELECGLIVYKRREKDPMAKFSRSRSVAYTTHPATAAGTTVFQFTASNPLDSLTMVKNDEDEEEVAGGELLDDHKMMARDEPDHALSSSHRTSAPSPPKPSKKRWLSQALMEEDIEASKSDKSMFSNASFPMQVSLTSKYTEPQLLDTARQEHTSLNPKKRVMAEMAKDSAPSEASTWSTSSAVPVPSDPNNWVSTSPLLTQEEKHKSMSTSKLPPKKATVKLQAEELKMQLMGKVRVSLSEYRRRRGLSITDLSKPNLTPTGTPETQFSQTLLTDGTPLTQLPINFDNLLEKNSTIKTQVTEEEEIELQQEQQQVDEQHGPRTPSEPPDDDEEEDEEENGDTDAQSPLRNHNRSPMSTILQSIPPSRSHPLTPASCNGQQQKLHSLDLAELSEAKLHGRLPSPPRHQYNRSVSSSLSKSASEPLSQRSSQMGFKKSPFTDCIEEAKGVEKNVEALHTVLLRDQEIRLWQEVQRGKPQPHVRRSQNYSTYSDNHNCHVSSLRDSELSPHPIHTPHLGSRNLRHKSAHVRAFSRDRTNNPSSDRLAIESPQQSHRLVENIENVHEALCRHRDHLRAQLDNMTAAGRQTSSTTLAQSSGTDTNGPASPAPMPPGILNGAYLCDFLVPHQASSS